MAVTSEVTGLWKRPLSGGGNREEDKKRRIIAERRGVLR
jgi:hypothetical protein